MTNEYNHSNDSGNVFFLIRVCFVASLGGLLFGYDTAVISGAIGFLQQHFQLSPAMMGWAASSALVGCFLGVPLAGILSDRAGRKTTLIFAALLFLISALGSAMAQTLTEFVIFRMIGGFGVGIASMTSPMYIAEISPARHRGRMVSLNQFAIIFGMLVVYFVNYTIAGISTEEWNVTTGWRWMFGSEIIPALFLLIFLFFVPETPRFLCRKGQTEKAQRVLTKVVGAEAAKITLLEIKTTLHQKNSSIAVLFQTPLRRVLIIGIALAILQQVTGINVILYYAPEIFRQISQAGTDTALLQTVLVGAVNLIFTVIAIKTVDRIGRKPLMMVGAAGMGISLTAIGIAAYLQTIGPYLLIFILGYIASFALSVGPVTWVILSEIFPNKIRGRAMAIATFFLWVANFIVSQTFPILNNHPWLVETFNRGFPFWLYASFTLLLLVTVHYFIPETKNRSLEEIEAFWKER